MSIATKCTCGHSLTGVCASSVKECNQLINMEKNTQLPGEVETQIEKDATARYRATEEGKLMAVGYKTAATAYASKLHQVEQENAELKRWKKEQIALFDPLYDYGMSSKEIKLGESIVTFILNKCREYDKLKQQATGWRPLLEEVLKHDAAFGELSIEMIDKIKKFLYGE